MKLLFYIGLVFGFINILNAQNVVLKTDKELGLQYHNIPCKEILDGHSFVKDSSISTCADKILKEYVIEAKRSKNETFILHRLGIWVYKYSQCTKCGIKD